MHTSASSSVIIKKNGGKSLVKHAGATNEVEAGRAKTDLPPGHAEAGNLALAAITALLNGPPTPRVATEEDATAHVLEEIEAARVRGETLLAYRLADALEKAQATNDMADNSAESHQAALTGQASLRQQQYDAALVQEKDLKIRGLRHNMRLDADEAEAHFAKYDQAGIEAALRRIHGLPELRT